MNQKDKETALLIAKKVAERGGSAYFVGGYVRDSLLGIENKDIDMEVHGIPPHELEEILDSVGERTEYGKSFGVYSIKGTSIDVAMPRKETAVGRGHKDFDIDVDPYIGTVKASMRRDFSIGAIMQNVLTGEIVDHFGGRDDLRSGVIRHVCAESFIEDPLRVLRCAQFAARFGFTVAEPTIEFCKKMDISTLPKERVFEELKKALLKAQQPSVFFEVLREMNKLREFFPELHALIGVEQGTLHHAEGDVWVHTMMVLDEAAKRRDEAKNPLGLMLCALTHDFGKAVCTEKINGVIHAYNHENAGLPLIKEFLARLTNEKNLTSYVLNLDALHMKPNTMQAHGSSVKSTNKMFDEAAEPHDLLLLAVADNRGRRSEHPFVDTEPFLRERLAVYEEYMSRPFVGGKDLVAAGLTPTEDFSEILAYAHKLRLAGIPKESALKQTLAFAKKLP